MTCIPTLPNATNNLSNVGPLPSKSTQDRIKLRGRCCDGLARKYARSADSFQKFSQHLAKHSAEGAPRKLSLSSPRIAPRVFESFSKSPSRLSSGLRMCFQRLASYPQNLRRFPYERFTAFRKTSEGCALEELSQRRCQATPS